MTFNPSTGQAAVHFQNDQVISVSNPQTSSKFEEFLMVITAIEGNSKCIFELLIFIDVIPISYDRNLYISHGANWLSSIYIHFHYFCMYIVCS